jgi:hypothetical protein
MNGTDDIPVVMNLAEGGGTPTTAYSFLTYFPDVLRNRRIYLPVRNPDGSATVHIVIRCTLYQIAQASNLRVDDVAFTLHEVGLLDKTIVLDPQNQSDSPNTDVLFSPEDTVEITREKIEEVSAERNVKPPSMHPLCVLLKEEIEQKPVIH